MKVLSVVGARPQFVKLAPVAAECARRGVEHVIVHTGQHYDPMLSDVFFRDLGIPDPDVHLGVGSGGHGVQTGAILGVMDAVLETQGPDWVLVYGDTNSTLAGALSAVKLHLPVAHLEAGLRSFNRRMPEEHNRVLTDHAADLLLAPTEVARGHLTDEGLGGRTVVVGDVMIDVLMRVRDELVDSEAVLAELGVPSGGFSLATVHRAENTDDPDRLRAIVTALQEVDHPVVLLAHPRLRARAEEHGLDLDGGSLTTRPPLPYPALVGAVAQARGVITDSGGLQKEAFALRTPCTTVRTETEWVETVRLGWNVLVEPGPAVRDAASRPAPAPTDEAPYGDGSAAAAVLDALGSAPRS
ncbi:non-hydrolyzing UDP-N-acetylglucosamine 2-epimerase [Ornithinimicrobium cerasi]|uniref:UDP-N-acetylglucosamine 2-epimerase (Non-hydrolysing) n=1 Tax=Ornithinimicrobium cerasi TaxID=2248773 RepID=A0A285VB03_9MICO|nr:UDP-N-acetylglucosamine 2-epimerase (non-hydrolyzing) [Ornithinimicrobium cerasi]SOC51295.1 UDP-N-acetylglucosamine 2-epimerase (non-hydrolysing) [Ornithinimicrobium cerasi]